MAPRASGGATEGGHPEGAASLPGGVHPAPGVAPRDAGRAAQPTVRGIPGRGSAGQARPVDDVPIPPEPGGLTVSPLFGWEQVALVLVLLVVLVAVVSLVAVLRAGRAGRPEWQAWLDARPSRRDGVPSAPGAGPRTDRGA